MTEPQEVSHRFPIAGIDQQDAFERQNPREVAKGLYARSTILGVNVQGYEPATERGRGGSRPGLAKYIPQRVADFVIQDLAIVTFTED